MGSAAIHGPGLVPPGPLRPPRLTVPTWRRLLGLAITLASVAAVAFVGQSFGWMTDAQASTRAAQAADGHARLVAMALRQLVPDGEPGEARFAGVAAGLDAVLVRDDYRGPTETVLIVQVHGRTMAGAFGGRRVVDVVRCYALDWRPPDVADPQLVPCPDMPAVPPSSPAAQELAQQLNGLGGLGSGPYLAAGIPGACAFGEYRSQGFLAWPAPVTARCDAAEVAKAATFVD
ncbi:hypothetical protein [Streptacidiphilus jiangxiensis]|uniref:Uncharacterized protein n=1 Tax=Streptacidiphilus jiangxiensis TaxID=235985 RepID=A0A1H7X198_STRJI|nr:hypothetical protein [Streptacidiphilus jiangxiensis]SEM27656.1 hypothetical protein SAMN05414137_12275 [Streptacidiphilus jiangxiensis]